MACWSGSFRDWHGDSGVHHWACGEHNVFYADPDEPEFILSFPELDDMCNKELEERNRKGEEEIARRRRSWDCD